MKIINANGLRFNTAIAGSGPPLLFLTGSGADLRKANTPMVPTLTNHFSVLTYDQRGMGQSDKPDTPYTMLDYAEDAIAIVDDCGWGEFLLAGYSFGGMVAQEIAIRWPARVSRLVLAASTAGGEGGASYPIQQFVGMAPYERARRGLEVADLGFTPQWQADNPQEAESRIQQRVKAQTMFADEPGAAIGQQRQLEARSTHNTYERLDQITTPTLVIAGTDDGQATLACQKAMADKIPNCQFNTIADGTHDMLWASDNVFAKMVEFLCEK